MAYSSIRGCAPFPSAGQNPVRGNDEHVGGAYLLNGGENIFSAGGGGTNNQNMDLSERSKLIVSLVVDKIMMPQRIKYASNHLMAALIEL